MHLTPLQGLRSRAWIAALTALLVSGCSVTRPLEVSPSPTGMGSQAWRALSLHPEQPGTPSAGFHTHIAESLKQAGIALDPQARVIADVSLSVAPAEIGIVSKPADGNTAERSVQWLVAPRDKRLLDRCRAQRMKGILSLFDRENGNLVFRNQTTAVACSFSAEDRRAAADALVANLIANRPA